MNKKGFTLVELLAVLVILVVLAGLIVPVVTTSFKQAEEGAYNKQIATLESAAKKWGIENGDMLPDLNSTSIITIDFDVLINAGHLKDEKIINPKTNEELEGCIKVSYDNEYNQYEYKFTDNLLDCQNYNINNL